jgi:hypothetical protein
MEPAKGVSSEAAPLEPNRAQGPHVGGVVPELADGVLEHPAQHFARERIEFTGR